MSSIEKEWVYRYNPSLVSEYLFCPKSFWLHHHRFHIHPEFQPVRVGKAEHDAKEGESRNPWIKYDQMVNGVIIEFTKRNRNTTGKKMQLLMYMLRANVHCGEVRETITNELILKVDLTEETTQELFSIVRAMDAVADLAIPPDVSLEEKCKHCSFYDYCWAR